MKRLLAIIAAFFVASCAPAYGQAVQKPTSRMDWQKGQAFSDTVAFRDTVRYTYIPASVYLKVNADGELVGFDLDSLFYVADPRGVSIGYYNAPITGQAASVLIGSYNAESATRVSGSVLIGDGIANPADTVSNSVAIGQNALNQFEGGLFPNESYGFDNMGSLTTGGFNASYGHDGFFSMSTGYWNAGIGAGSGDGIGQGYQLTLLGARIEGQGGNYRGTTALGFGAQVTGDNQFVIGCDTVPAGEVDTVGATGFYSWGINVNGVNRELIFGAIGNTLTAGAIAYNNSGNLGGFGSYNAGADALNIGTTDVTANSVAVDGSGAYYFGPETVDGSWRVIRSGADLVIQVRVSGVWTTVQTFAHP